MNTRRASLAAVTLLLAPLAPLCQNTVSPLMAKYTVTVSRGRSAPRLIRTELLYRDSSNRGRVDATYYDRAGYIVDTHISILDPIQRRSYIVDPATGTATRSFFEPPSPELPPPGRSFLISPTAELGTQQINGYESKCTVYEESPFFRWQVVCHWVVSDATVLRIEARKDGSIEQTIATELRAVEPDPTLFQVPQGYTIRDR